MQIGKYRFEKGRSYVCGILNVTPDSFSDGGRFHNVDAALARAESMIQEGAALIDVGGESTRPGFTPVSEEEECERVIPVIERIKKNLDIPISVDTTKAAVAGEALKAGADVVNDIWGLWDNPDMARLIKEYDAGCVLMHNRNHPVYEDFLKDVQKDLKARIQFATEAGINPEHIIIDPGVGFAKDYEQNLMILNRLEIFTEMGYPVLLGVSRKSVIGNALNLPVEERLEGTLATTVMAVMKGCTFLRVHDVEANVRAIRMTQTIMNKG